jgi:molecular chaperone DnaJ
MRLEFMEAVHGITRKVTIPRRVSCEGCEGSGLREGADPDSCSTCGGMGQVVQAQGFLRIRTTCPTCRGSGQVVRAEDRCTECGGSGKVRETAELEIKVPAGSYTGLQIRHTGQGEAGDPGAPPGDLYVTLEVAGHELFKRDGADIFVTVPVPYPVMCLGGEITIPTVHGEDDFHVRRGTPSGHVEILRGKGVERLRARGTRGDQHVRLVVDVPASPSEEEEELLRKLAEVQDVGVQEKGFWQKFIGTFTG